MRPVERSDLSHDLDRKCVCLLPSRLNSPKMVSPAITNLVVSLGEYAVAVAWATS